MNSVELSRRLRCRQRGPILTFPYMGSTPALHRRHSPLQPRLTLARESADAIRNNLHHTVSKVTRPSSASTVQAEASTLTDSIVR
jgi:hypothetical protein